MLLDINVAMHAGEADASLLHRLYMPCKQRMSIQLGRAAPANTPTPLSQQRDEGRREPSLFNEVLKRYRVGLSLLLLATLGFSIVIWQLWDRWDHLQVFESTLGIIGFAAGIFSLFYSIVSAIQAERAQNSAQRVVNDLVRMGLLVDRAQSYKEAFDQHVSDLLRPEPNPTYGRLQEIRFLISTPAYGYHVLGSEYLGKFREGLLNTRSIPTQIILFSPDRHLDHVLNTIMWQNVPVPDEIRVGFDYPVERSDGKPLAEETCQILSLLRSYATFQGGHYQTWASHGGNVRLAYYGFTRDPQAFLLLSDRVGLSTDLLQYSVRVIPLHRQLILDTAARGGSYFDQFKTCPYSGRKGDEAAIDDVAEYVALASDYVWMRTRFPVYTYSAFRQELGGFFRAALADPTNQDAKRDVVVTVVKNLLDYFAFLRAPNSGLGVESHADQIEVIDAIDDLVTTGADAVDDAAVQRVFGAFEKKFKGLVLDGISDVGRLLSQTPHEGWYLLLFLLASSGYGLSSFAERRIDGQTP